MRYLILRKPAPAEDDLFLEPVAMVREQEAYPEPLPVSVEENLTDAQVQDLRRDPEVEEVVPSIRFKLVEPVEDPLAAVPAQMAWGLDAVGALTCPQDGHGVTVAVLDTGIDRDHPAFAGLPFQPDDLADFTEDHRGKPGSAPDTHGHGTHVAGTIFGRAVSGTRIGVAPGVDRALIGKVLGPGGGPTEAVFSAINWALRRGADVISMSLGMDFTEVTSSYTHLGYPLAIAISRALAAYRSNVRLFDRLAALVDARVEGGHGALLVAASGNESRRRQDERFTAAASPPAAADGFISVGAVEKTGVEPFPFRVASFSNTACRFAAPGVAVLSARVGGGLVSLNGTSMATPHAAGVFALWTQKLFPSGRRPVGWARDVLRAVEGSVNTAPGGTRADLGLGIVRAPR